MDNNGVTRNELSKVYKKMREANYRAEIRQSKMLEANNSQVAADLEYISMMTGIDMSQDEEE